MKSDTSFFNLKMTLDTVYVALKRAPKWIFGSLTDIIFSAIVLNFWSISKYWYFYWICNFPCCNFNFFGLFVIFCNKFNWFVDIEVRNRGQFYFYSLFDSQIKLRKKLDSGNFSNGFIMWPPCGRDLLFYTIGKWWISRWSWFDNLSCFIQRRFRTQSNI